MWNISKVLQFFREQERSFHSVLVTGEVFHSELQNHWQISSFSQRKAVWVCIFQRKLIFWQTTLMSMYVCIFQNALVIRCNCTISHIPKSYRGLRLWWIIFFFFKEKLKLVKTETYYYLRFNCNDYWKAESFRWEAQLSESRMFTVFVNG